MLQVELESLALVHLLAHVHLEVEARLHFFLEEVRLQYVHDRVLLRLGQFALVLDDRLIRDEVRGIHLLLQHLLLQKGQIPGS